MKPARPSSLTRVRLLIGGQLLAALLLPRLAPYSWLAGAFLLAPIPFEAALAEPPRRVPGYTSLAWLGAAGLLLVAFSAPYSNLAGAAWLLGGGLLAGAVCFGTWQAYRRRADSGRPVQFEAAGLLALGFSGLAGAVAAAALGGVWLALGIAPAARQSLLVGGLVAALALSAAVALVTRLAERLVQALQALTRATESMTAALVSGKPEQRMVTDGPIELEALAQAVNGLADAAQRRIFELQLSRSDLQAAASQRLLEQDQAIAGQRQAFLKTLIHDLRNPLTAIIGFARLNRRRLNERIFPRLAEQADPALQRTMGQVDQNLEVIAAEGERLSEMLERLRDLPRIEAGKVELGPMNARFHCAADVNHLAAVRNFVREAARPLCADEDYLYDLALAVDEAVTNVILHGYGDRPGEVRIEILPLADGLAVLIRDDAPPFDPTLAPEPDTSLALEQRQPGGMGIAFVRQLTDSMEYTAGTPEGNELRLVKRFPAGI